MGTYGGIQDVADRAAFYGGIKRALLFELLEERLGPACRWDGDGDTLVFSNAAGDQVSATATVIASVGPDPGSLMWGWAMEGVRCENNVAVRRLGERFGIDDLTTPRIPFAADADTADPREEVKLVARLAECVSLEAVRTGVAFSAEIFGGTYGVYHLEGIDLPDVTMTDVVSRVPRLLDDGLPCRDVRSATLGLSEHLGWNLRWTDAAGSSAELTSPDGGSALFSFDDQGHITGIEACR